MLGTPEKFLTVLKGFRRRELARCAWESLLRVAAFAPAALAAVLLIRRSGSAAAAWFVTAALSVAAAAYWAWRAPWSLRRCAGIADRETGGRMSVTNALELCRRGDRREFARFAIMLGAAAVPRRALRIEAAPPRWRTGVVSALILLPFFWISGSPDAARTDAGVKVPASFRRKATAIGTEGGESPRNSEAASGSNSAVRYRSEPSRRSGGDTGGASGLAAVSEAGTANRGECGNTTGGVNDPAGDGGSGERETQKTLAPRSRERAAARTAGGLPGGGDADDDDDGERDADAADAGGASGGSAAGRRDRRREKREKPPADTDAGGYRALLAEAQTPAGRELAEKDEHGDRPGEGRGGETGDKKSRGTAAALPVIPLPDNVTGRLGAGTDLRRDRRAENAGNSRPEWSSIEKTRFREPRSDRSAYPAALRRILDGPADNGRIADIRTTQTQTR